MDKKLEICCCNGSCRVATVFSAGTLAGIAGGIATSAWGFFANQLDNNPQNDNNIDVAVSIPTDWGWGGDPGGGGFNPF